MDLSLAKVSDESPVTMTWKATDVFPVSGGADIDVRLGRAGKVVMQVVIPEAVPL